MPDSFNAPEKPPARAAASLAPAPVASQPPVPLEPPFGPLRVPNAGLPCAVDTVFAEKCRRCHTIPPRHGAPFPLLTWQQSTKIFHGRPLPVLITRAVEADFMPYPVETNPPVQPLTPAEKKIILDWAAAGAPRGDCHSEASVPAPARAPL